MLAKRVVPCLDVDEGRVVKGVRFVELKDAGDPVELAARYNDEGADELVFLDITASHEQRGIILDVVSRTAETVFIPLTVGGGVRSVDDVKRLLRAGADKVAINTAAVRDPDARASDAPASSVRRRSSSRSMRVADGNGSWEVVRRGGPCPDRDRRDRVGREELSSSEPARSC